MLWFPDSRWRGSRNKSGQSAVAKSTDGGGQSGQRYAEEKFVERFTRVDADTLRFEFTVDDPTTWTKRWTAMNLLANTAGQVYEYACHEGNYGMFGILRGDRLLETEGADKAATERTSVSEMTRRTDHTLYACVIQSLVFEVQRNFENGAMRAMVSP